MKREFSQKDLDKLDEVVAFFEKHDPTAVPVFKAARERVYLELKLKED